MKRKIPATMATQHPDNSNPPFWKKDQNAFISTQDEPFESILCFRDLGIEEYMWDWEGKFVDEAIVERLFQNYLDFLKEKQIGKDIFLTFRIPNIWEEKGYRLVRAFMSILTASDSAKDLEINTPPLFEMILPMTKNASQIIKMKEMFSETALFKNKTFGPENGFTNIEMIPIFERVEDLINSGDIITEYLNYLKSKNENIEYIRPFIARSDPALNSGIVPSVLGAKIALSNIHNIGNKFDTEICPIIGSGSLPFRGNCNPENIKDYVNEYKGIKTTTIQSAFRYDFKEETVKNAINYLNQNLKNSTPRIFTSEEIDFMQEIIPIFENLYKPSIEKLAGTINQISKYIPKRRERVQHTGLFGYSRNIGKVSLPRAITFTASLYSIGIPPEIIATGRGISVLQKQGKLELLEKIYLNIKKDLGFSMKYVNEENLNLLKKVNPVWQNIFEDYLEIKEYLKDTNTEETTNEQIHRNLTSTILLKLNDNQDISSEVEEAGILRKSLG